MEGIPRKEVGGISHFSCLDDIEAGDINRQKCEKGEEFNERNFMSMVGWIRMNVIQLKLSTFADWNYSKP